MIADPREAEDSGPPSPLETRLLFYGASILVVVILFGVALFTT